MLTELSARVPAWVSLTCSGGLTRAGEPVEEAFAMTRDVPEVVAVGVNCTEASEVAALADMASHEAAVPVVVYPNSGEEWDAQRHAWTGRASYAPEQIDSWVAHGARLVGGCCRVGPAQIADIAARLTR